MWLRRLGTASGPGGPQASRSGRSNRMLLRRPHYQGVASTASITRAVTAPPATSIHGIGGGSPPGWPGAIAATVSQGKYGNQAASTPPRARPVRIENSTASAEPTRNGQAGVLRILRALATIAGPVAMISAIMLRIAHHGADRNGSTRAAKSEFAAIRPSSQPKPSRLAISTG